METKTLIANVRTQIRQKADVNGDGKINMADVEAALSHAETHASHFVEARTPLTALVIVAVGFLLLGLVIGSVSAKVFGG